MTLSLWATLVVACVVISLTPGAGAINTMSDSLRYGFRRAIWGVLGLQTALVIHIAIVALGLGVLVRSSPLLFEIIRYTGAAYLVYLGVRQLLAKPTADASTAPDSTVPGSTESGSTESGSTAPVANTARPEASESRWVMYRRGVWVNLLNPKAIVFFLAFLPQFIRLDEPLLPQYLLVGATVVVIDVIIMWGFFGVAAQSMRRFTRSARGQRIVNIVFGVLFICVGLLLAIWH